MIFCRIVESETAAIAGAENATASAARNAVTFTIIPLRTRFGGASITGIEPKPLPYFPDFGHITLAESSAVERNDAIVLPSKATASTNSLGADGAPQMVASVARYFSVCDGLRRSGRPHADCRLRSVQARRV